MKLNITEVLKLLYYITLFIPLLPILFFLLFKIKSKERTVWVIFIYILYYFVHELVSFYLQTRDTNFIFNLFALYTIAEFTFISYYYYLVFEGKKAIKRIIIFVVLAFLTFAISNLVFSKNMESWDSFAIGIESLIIILFSAYFLFTKIKTGQSLKIYTTFHFWVAVTFILYFSGTFFFNIMAESMRKNPDYQTLYRFINIGFLILKNVLLAVAMTMQVSKTVPQNDLVPDLDEDFLLNKIQ